jgi:hypothetical protein
MCEEPLYSQRIKPLIFASSPWWRRFYDARMSKAFFDRKLKYARRFLSDRSIEELLSSMSAPTELETPQACALFAYMLIALRMPDNPQGRLISQLPQFLNFVGTCEEQLTATPYRGSNLLASSVEAFSSDSSRSTVSACHQYLYYAPFAVASAVVFGLVSRSIMAKSAVSQ